MQSALGLNPAQQKKKIYKTEKYNKRAEKYVSVGVRVK